MKPVVTHGDYEAAQAQWILSVVLEGTPKIRRRALFFSDKKSSASRTKSTESRLPFVIYYQGFLQSHLLFWERL